MLITQILLDYNDNENSLEKSSLLINVPSELFGWLGGSCSDLLPMQVRFDPWSPQVGDFVGSPVPLHSNTTEMPGSVLVTATLDKLVELVLTSNH